MINGPERFNFHLDRLEKQLLEAGKQPDPALWLYQNNARTPLFMLEGLARLYSGLHNQKKFKKIEARFKIFEDTLGSIDYYEGFAGAFARDKTIPAAITKAVRAKAVEKAKLLNSILKEKNWVGPKPDRIKKIQKKLREVYWLEDKPEMKRIEHHYGESIARINAFAKKHKSGFTELETEVHELRRKLRWLSIYPQALQGSIQLTKTSSKDKNVAKYRTPEIVNSPFNKLPHTGANRYVLVFNRDYFLALSWMISELGKLKDQGLRTFVLNEVGKTSPSDAKNDAAILSKASDIMRIFFEEKNLDKMIVGIQSNNPNP